MIYVCVSTLCAVLYLPVVVAVYAVTEGLCGHGGLGRSLLLPVRFSLLSVLHLPILLQSPTALPACTVVFVIPLLTMTTAKTSAGYYAALHQSLILQML